ncbi:hypothetical protein KK120_22060 [Virgibacillus dakarensis]|uniref:hypothetical protein n=1 Tax=Virgibacillus dokdonensis TaxID=302167 RepID=UPI00098A6D31|nr:hypothetical protein [Virgibacillus dokdonensis]MBT2218483.1 hypothetical protein [Virgibacillus dakarensis]
MKEILEQLYDELYSPKVNPEELINNATLPNYISVNIVSNQIGLMVTTECIVDKDIEAKYKYQFDKEKRLLTLVGDIDGEIDVIYDRSKEITRKYKEIKEYMEFRVQAV